MERLDLVKYVIILIGAINTKALCCKNVRVTLKLSLVIEFIARTKVTISAVLLTCQI